MQAARTGKEVGAAGPEAKAQLSGQTADVSSLVPPDVAVLPPGGEVIEVAGGSIPRTILTVLQEAGIGLFLQRVEIEPHLEKGRFVGWRLIRLSLGDPRVVYRSIKPGDIITRVNGKSIERPESFKAVWDSMAEAQAMDVELLRQGRAYLVRYLIEERGPEQLPETLGVSSVPPPLCSCSKKDCKCSDAEKPK